MVGAVFDRDKADDRSAECAERSQQYQITPIGTTYDFKQVRCGRAHGERADEYADGHATIRFKPGCHDFHAGWIDPGEEEAGAEAQNKRRVNAIDEQADGAIGHRAAKSAEGEKAAGVEDIGEIE